MQQNEEERDWLLAAAGNEALAEELRTGTCRCGVLLGEESDGCRWHPLEREKIKLMLRATWTGATMMEGPRGADLELLGRYLPRDFLFAYEVLVHRSVVVPGSARGYDENAVVGAGRGTGGLGSARSGEKERRIGTGGGGRGGRAGGAGSGRAVVRDEVALARRRSADRKLRKMARELLNFLEGNGLNRVVYRCTGRRCGKFAEAEWSFCPSCGSRVEASEPKK